MTVSEMGACTLLILCDDQRAAQAQQGCVNIAFTAGCTFAGQQQNRAGGAAMTVSAMGACTLLILCDDQRAAQAQQGCVNVTFTIAGCTFGNRAAVAAQPPQVFCITLHTAVPTWCPQPCITRYTAYPTYCPPQNCGFVPTVPPTNCDPVCLTVVTANPTDCGRPVPTQAPFC